MACLGFELISRSAEAAGVVYILRQEDDEEGTWVAVQPHPFRSYESKAQLTIQALAEYEEQERHGGEKHRTNAALRRVLLLL